MEWIVQPISEEVAHKFLRDNHATREVVYIQHHDEWCGIYNGDKLISVTGMSVHPKRGHVHTGGSYTLREYRGQGCFKAIYVYIMNKYADKDFICYCRPETSHVLQKYHGFIKTQSFKNGTDKCILRRNHGKTKN